MKNMKRLLAMLLATVMILSLFGVTAFATGEDGNDSNPAGQVGDDAGTETDPSPSPSQDADTTTNNSGTIKVPTTGSANQTGSKSQPITTIPVYKTLNVETAGVTLPEENFYVQMVPATVSDGTKVSEDSNVDVDAGLPLANDTLTFEYTAADKTTSGSVVKLQSFDLTLAEGSAFEHSGVYRYEITEVTKDDDGNNVALTEQEEGQYITYDTTKYTVDLYVEEGETEGQYVIVAVAVKDEKDTKPTAVSFENSISCCNIIIKKIVEGTPYSSNESFLFRILIPVKGDTITLKLNAAIQAQIFDSEDQAVGDVFTLDVKGEDINADMTTNANTFYLKDGQYLKITAPVSMIYKVQEEVASKEGYTTTVEYEEEGKFKASTTRDLEDDSNIYSDTIAATETTAEMTVAGARGTTNTRYNCVTFTNKRVIPNDTGVNLDFLPYVLVLVGALAIGGAWFFFRKRRTVR
jgi:hypothetical protein